MEANKLSHSERMQFFNKKIDRQGFLRSRVRIARIGIQDYADYGKVMRPATEVIRSIPTFDNQIITQNHPNHGVDADNAKDLQIGFISNVRYRDGWLEGMATITDSEVISSIMSGEALEFSCGYDADIVKETGLFKEEAYDCYVTNIVGNHIALVSQARAGSDATFIDSLANTTEQIISSNNNVIKNIMDESKQVVAPTKVLLDKSLEAETSELRAKVLRLESQLSELQSANKGLQDSMDTISAQKDALEVKINDSALEVKPDLTGEEIAARVEAWTTIKPRLNDSVDVDYGLTVPEVRKLWLQQELPNLAEKIKSGSEAYISGLWDSVSEKLTAPQPEAIPVPVKDSIDEPLISVLQAPLSDSVDALEQARKAYIERLAANRG